MTRDIILNWRKYQCLNGNCCVRLNALKSNQCEMPKRRHLREKRRFPSPQRGRRMTLASRQYITSILFKLSSLNQIIHMKRCVVALNNPYTVLYLNKALASCILEWLSSNRNKKRLQSQSGIDLFANADIQIFLNQNWKQNVPKVIILTHDVLHSWQRHSVRTLQLVYF